MSGRGRPRTESGSADGVLTESGGSAPRGRTRVTARALTRLATAVAASALEVPARDVRASVSDVSGELGIRICSPLALRPLGRRRAGSGETALDRAERARSRIAEEVAALSGHRVGAVSLELNGAAIREERRPA